jgi:hypothetical protein
MKTIQQLIITSYTLIIIVCCTSIIVCCTRNKNENKNNVEAEYIADTAILINSAISRIGIRNNEVPNLHYPPPEWEDMDIFKKMVSESQLIQFTDHKYNTLRCYAFLELARRNSKMVYPVLIKHLSDTGIVFIDEGCRAHYKCVGDYYMDITQYYLNDKTQKLSMSTNQRHEIDSIYGECKKLYKLRFKLSHDIRI